MPGDGIERKSTSRAGKEGGACKPVVWIKAGDLVRGIRGI